MIIPPCRHSNGFSLVRKVFDVENSKKIFESPAELGGKTIGEALLAPTKIYVKPMLALFDAVKVKAVSHITGGGFYETIPRSMPAGLSVRINKKDVRTQPIFDISQHTGNIPERDMFNTTNMGVGMCCTVSAADADTAVATLRANGTDAYIMGEIAPGDEGVIIG